VDELQCGTPAEQIGILYHDVIVARAMAAALDRYGVRFRWAVSSEEKKQLFAHADEVKLVTLESSKGLEFTVAFLPGISGPRAGEDPVQVTRLLYVAMTRAMVRLVMSCTQLGEMAQRVQRTVAASGARGRGVQTLVLYEALLQASVRPPPPGRWRR
jgi:superfamily I DNA/RNA helicase